MRSIAWAICFFAVVMADAAATHFAGTNRYEGMYAIAICTIICFGMVLYTTFFDAR